MRIVLAGRPRPGAWRNALGLVVAAAILGWSASRDPVAATYARAVAQLAAGAKVAEAPVELTLRLLDRASAPGAEVLVDGRPVAGFATRVVRLDVRPGERVTVDARPVPGELLVLAAWGGGEGRSAGARVLRLRGSIAELPWDSGP